MNCHLKIVAGITQEEMHFRDISNNYKAAKPVAIFTVMASHYLGGLLWVPTVIALFLFGFSSGLFTSLKYKGDFSLIEFWKSKFFRLVPRLVVINFFLFVLFLMQGKKGVFSWHTLPNLIGMSGFLNWFSIENESPFGMGLWFFTLLLLFYAFYPFIFSLKRVRYGQEILLLLSIILTSYLQFHIKCGYQLWPTALSFIVGSYCANRTIRHSPFVFVCMGVVVSIVAIVANVRFNYSNLNYFFLLVLSLSITLLLVAYPVPFFMTRWVTWLDCCVLEIYFIHPYLFVYPADFPRVVGFLFSLLLVVGVSYVLGYVGRKLEGKFW